MTTAGADKALPPVRKRITVRCTPDQAFDLFTAGIARWWPLATHSVGLEDAANCAIEPRVGGRLFETDKAGSERQWGEVLVWEPPRRLVFTWHPGRAAETAQTVEVTFTGEGDVTVLRLEHRDWHRAGDHAEAVRNQYDQGWRAVLDSYIGSTAA